MKYKFRGKRLETREWFYGDVHYGREYKSAHIHDVPGCHHGQAVDPRSIGLFTGLIDKDGVDIYEGDICTNISGLKWQVSWDEEDARFYLLYADATSGNCRMNQSWILDTEVEVIGNITSNPELLKA